MTVRYTEVRSGTWNGAANDIIQRLKQLGVKKGQVISIDAHNNGPKGDAIFSAIWDDAMLSKGDLSIHYHVQNEKYPWHTFYEKAANFVSSEVNPEALISITGSCNEGGRGVLYVFYYMGNPAGHMQRQAIHFCEARSRSSWNEAAKGILSKLKNSGAKQGQIISIDAHSNDKNGDAIFHAFWNASLPAQGELEMEYKEMNSDTSWESFYMWATDFISGKMLDVQAITSSINTSDRAVCFIFYNLDGIKEVKFSLDQGKIVSTKPKVLTTLKNSNSTDTQQELAFSYEETISNSSTFQHEVGVGITVGTEFKTGVPFIAEGKISMELSLSYSHSWGSTTQTDETSVAAVTTKADPQTMVTCQFRANQSVLDVPYVIKMRSGKEGFGKWKGVNVWDVEAHFSEEKL